MKNDEIEALSYELIVVLEGMLYFAGVKKDSLQVAAEIYADIIDDVLENSDAEGSDQVIEVVEYMRKNYPSLFRN